MGSHSKGRFKACTEDRISGLPNEILCHILSFLGTDVAVKTSLLSHRWKNVWTKVPTITLWDFDYRNSFYRDRFGEFVDHVLLSRGSSDIHTFQLHCSEFEDDSRFDAWICPAVERNVVELEFSVLCYLCEESGMDWEDWLYEFPRSLYMCKTLVVLKLRLLSVITITPTLDCFPSLKVLHLTICHTDTDSMGKPISCCPVLEDLIIVGSLQEFSYLEFNISALKLNSLLIYLEPFGRDKYNIFVNINAPNVENLESWMKFWQPIL
ncbi:hypothetical protein PRUPE_5G021800 [Prunus persica]|uniref:F-box domain-containing protein n=1 Tax=Prunus persica TaxID=3760 RepID=A0A251P2G7_PRUPE|nr:hypothetical protein PRUPE_5G021800 [Prunus persica]